MISRYFHSCLKKLELRFLLLLYRGKLDEETVETYEKYLQAPNAKDLEVLILDELEFTKYSFMRPFNHYNTFCRFYYLVLSYLCLFLLAYINKYLTLIMLIPSLLCFYLYFTSERKYYIDGLEKHLVKATGVTEIYKANFSRNQHQRSAMRTRSLC